MPTNDTGESGTSVVEILDATATVLAGGGLLTMVLFPLALPCIVLVAVPLIAIGLVAVVAGVILAAVAVVPLVLLRLVRSLVGGERPSRDPVQPAPVSSTDHL